MFANHGVFNEEKSLGQKFILSLELHVDLSEASKNGDLTKSVHYGELCHNIEKEFQKES
ncbi:dihydroneopterin aldolase, partial [Clostridium perfringens]|uniref:dihydroneopterin aldolase n=1 Tax=Clostridium perfringens TaxID=1502 RepID=UPI002ACDEF91